jgi:type IV pilus assembly protein PilM
MFSMNALLQKYLTIVQKFIPQSETKPLIGLDLGTNSCKVVELIRKGDKYLLTNFTVEPIVDGNPKDTIKKTWEKIAVSGKSPATAVFGKGTLIRFITMPKMSLEELKSSFALEADKYFPFPQDQIYMDCYILDNKGKENKMSVLIAAAKKELVDVRVKMLTELGLNPELITLNSIAVANAVGTLGYKQEGPVGPAAAPGTSSAVAILDMGGEVSNLTILIDNVPAFTRDIFIGSQEITKNISRSLNISLEEAEKLKFQPGDRASEIVNASDSILMDLVSEIRLSFDYFVTEKNTPVPILLFTGGGSLLGGILDFLAKHLEVKVMRWDPIEAVELGPAVSKEAIASQGSKLTVALGLALSQK